MRRRHFMVFLAGAAACGFAAWPAVAEDGPAERMLVQLNAIRDANGLARLVLDAQLGRAAQVLATDMARTGTLDHRASDGSDLKLRLSRAGYGYRVAAENIAYGIAAPEVTVERWMTSDGHRRNMLMPELRHAGVGYAMARAAELRARPYWALVVAAPLARQGGAD